MGSGGYLRGMGRRWGSVVVVCALAALGAAPAGAAESEPTSAEVAAELSTPSCAEGARQKGEVIVGTDCSDTIVVPATVTYVNGGPGNDVIVGSQTGAVTPCPEGCHLEVGSQTFEGGEGDDLVYGDRGNDNLRGDATIDHIFDTGASGIDTLSFATGATPGFGVGITAPRPCSTSASSPAGSEFALSRKQYGELRTRRAGDRTRVGSVPETNFLLEGRDEQSHLHR